MNGMVNVSRRLYLTMVLAVFNPLSTDFDETIFGKNARSSLYSSLVNSV